jgi:hypothetical protein
MLRGRRSWLPGKTKKPRTINLANIYEEVHTFTLVDSEWLFPSSKGDMPITLTQASIQLNKASSMVDIEDGIGTHILCEKHLDTGFITVYGCG